MKLDKIKIIVAVLISALCTYGLSLFDNVSHNILFLIVCLIEFGATLTMALGIDISGMRTMTNIKVSSWLFFLTGFIANLAIGIFGGTTPAIILVNGGLMTIFLMVISSLIKASRK
jgi:hypothetical protein